MCVIKEREDGERGEREGADTQTLIDSETNVVQVLGVSPSFERFFLKGKIWETPPGLPRVREMGYGGESIMTVPNTWCVPVTYPECLYYGKKYRYERYNVERHMHSNIGKTTVKERTVTVCKESLPKSRGPLRNRFLVQTEMSGHRECDKIFCFQKCLHRQNGTCCWLEVVQTL